MAILQQNIFEERTAKTEDNFVNLHLYIVFTDKSNISEMLVTKQTFEAATDTAGKIIPG